MASGNTHEDYTREEHVEGSSDRGFGQVFAGFFAILAVISLWRGGTGWHYTLSIAAVFLVLAYTVPRVLAPLVVLLRMRSDRCRGHRRSTLDDPDRPHWADSRVTRTHRC